MSSVLVDLFAWRFWFAVAAALVLLTPILSARLRTWVLAVINLGFIRLLIGGQAGPIVGLLTGVVVFYFCLHWLGQSRQKRFGVAVITLLVTALFILHKLPDAFVGLDEVSVLLRAIAFSYVALRMVEVVRGISDGLHVPSLPRLFNYLMPFNMLAAGPIQSFDEYVTQPEISEPLNFAQTIGAIERITTGMFKKYVLAFFIERLFLTGFTAGGWYFFLEVQLHFLWVYLDFSAYSDIAVGVGNLVGIPTPENFNQPYFARNMIDFWKRWHITLSQWLLRNVFIPLQLFFTRRTSFNPLLTSSVSLFVTFLLCGLWHRFNLPFALWGVMNAVGVIASNAYHSWLTARLGRQGLNRYLANRPIRVVATIATFEFVAFATLVLSYPTS